MTGRLVIVRGQEGVMEFMRRKLRVVLLVDDDRELLGAWIREIKRHLTSPIRFHNALGRTAALSLAQSEKPDLAIVDQHLGDGLGTDLLPELRQCAPDLLIILTSCDLTHEDARRAGSHAIAAVKKPKSWAPYFRAIEAGENLEQIDHRPETMTLAAVETCHISRVLRENRNNVAATARVLGVDRSGLQRKLAKLGITVPPPRRNQFGDDDASR